LKNITITIADVGIPGILGPDLSFNLGKMVEKECQEALAESEKK